MAIILDSGFIYAYYNTDDVNHSLTIELNQEINNGKFGAIYLTDYLFDETVTLVFNRSNFQKALTVGKFLLESFDIIKIDGLAFNESWIRFQKYKLSFTDCTILSIMDRYKIQYLATFDKGFKGIVKTVGV